MPLLHDVNCPQFAVIPSLRSVTDVSEGHLFQKKLCSASADYEEKAAGLKLIRDGEIFKYIVSFKNQNVEIILKLCGCTKDLLHRLKSLSDVRYVVSNQKNNKSGY